LLFSACFYYCYSFTRLQAANPIFFRQWPEKTNRVQGTPVPHLISKYATGITRPEKNLIPAAIHVNFPETEKQHLPQPGDGSEKERIKQPHDKLGVKNNLEAVSSAPAARFGSPGFFSHPDPACRGRTICWRY
jgi:hypothetical protein